MFVDFHKVDFSEAFDDAITTLCIQHIEEIELYQNSKHANVFSFFIKNLLQNTLNVTYYMVLI